MSEILEGVRCNICESSAAVPFLVMDGFTYQKCYDCGLVYQNPRPVFRDLKKRYGPGYFDYEFSNQRNFFHLMKLGLKDIEFDAMFNEKEVHKKKFLDIGCATGLLLNFMKEKGWQTKGVEICESSAEYAIKNFGIDVFIGTMEEASFPDNHFDVIHFSHVIEHVPDPKAMLLEVRRILKRDGHMIITTPNVDGMQARLSKGEWRSAIPDHIYLFSKKTLGNLLNRTGYRIRRQISWGGIPIGKRPGFIKKPADKLAKAFNFGDVMLFHCTRA